jgi:hypothetical protein
MTEPAAGYYDHPIVKPPVWEVDIPWYLFTGGLAGGSATLSLAARLRGNRVLARRSILIAGAAITASPALLIHDLGRPERFLNMLRVFKPTSPMNVGTWLLTAAGTATTATAALDLLDRAPVLRGALAAVSGLTGPAVATYTGVLLADTANPAWYGARRELPWVFAAGAAASAGAAAQLVSPEGADRPARRLMLLGTLGEECAGEIMQRRLGDTASAYRRGRAKRFRQASRLLDGAGLALSVPRSRTLRRAGAAMILGAAVARRFAIFHAGFEAARDPRFTIERQRPAG